MTRTEERLADALAASASRVRDDRLRPLSEPATSSRRIWGHRLTPLAAAAAVVLAIGLAVAITGSVRNAPDSTRPTNRGVSLPPYNVAFSAKGIMNQGVTVYSTSTGKAIATAPCPYPFDEETLDVAVAAAPDDRTFYVEYNLDDRILIYTFSLSGQDKVTGMRLIPGGDIAGASGLADTASLVVSPDGTELALTSDTIPDLSATTDYADRIIVIDLKTGHRSEWQGGLHRTGKVFSIPDLSFTADGQSLVFLALWCDAPIGDSFCAGQSAKDPRSAQVRVLGTDGRGGLLSSSRIVLTQSARYPVIAQALAGPDGSDLTVLVLSGPFKSQFGLWGHLTIDHIAMGSGALLGVDYQTMHTTGSEGQPGFVGLGADPSNRDLLLADTTSHGWIEDGVFHPVSHLIEDW